MDLVDITVFGASGFTGRFVVKELARLARDPDQDAFTFGIAGRNSGRLRQVLSDIYDDNLEAGKIAVFEANVDDPDSLVQMTKSCRLVINCVGPYRFYGERVVSACVATGTDCIDISGEPEFMEKMVLKYNDRAREKDVAIVSACGFDSIPADLGVLYTLSQFDADIRPEQVESFIRILGPNPTFHAATYETAIHSFSGARKLRTHADSESIRRRNPPRKWPFFESRVGGWAVLFPGSDASVVKRTQRFLSGHGLIDGDVEYSAYFIVESFVSLVLLTILGTMIWILSRFRIGQRLLLKHPEFFTCGRFTKRGPSEEEMAQNGFEMVYFGTGTGANSRMTVKTRLRGPEPGYLTTAILVTQGAHCLLKNKSVGGVLTPGSVFYKTDYLARLENRGLKLSVLEKQRFAA